MQATAEPLPVAPGAKTEPSPPAKLNWAGFEELVRGAERGDQACRVRLREAIKSGEYPEWAQWFYDQHGNPAQWLKRTIVLKIGGSSDLAVMEGSLGKMGQVQKELEGAAPTPIERLLAERAAICWFMVHVYEAQYAQSKDLTPRQSDAQLRRIDSAHRRFLSSLSTLARVRKLALPALQVNIGASQVNVMQAGG